MINLEWSNNSRWLFQVKNNYHYRKNDKMKNLSNPECLIKEVRYLGNPEWLNKRMRYLSKCEWSKVKGEIL